MVIVFFPRVECRRGCADSVQVVDKNEVMGNFEARNFRFLRFCARSLGGCAEIALQVVDFAVS